MVEQEETEQTENLKILSVIPINSCSIRVEVSRAFT